MFQGVLLFQTAVPLLHQFQHILKAEKSYIKDTGDFLEKLKNLGNILFNAILVIADAVGLYPSIPQDAGLQPLYEKLEERTNKKNSSAELVEMAEFVLKNSFFEFELKLFSKLLEQPLELSLIYLLRVCFWIE